ncbi:MAG: helix-turn-helix domain-containing protein [Tepidisphaeraceae bacterium]
MPRRPLRDLDAMMGPKRIARARALADKKLKRILIGHVREELGLTQAQVARAMGVTQSALSQMESQEDMQLSTIRRMAHAMGGDVDVILRFGKSVVVLTAPQRGARRSTRRRAG